MRFTAFLSLIFLFSNCNKPCTDPPEFNYIDEKNFAWLPDSAVNFYMISDKGIETQFILDTPIQSKPTTNSNPINCPELNTESISRSYKTTYLGDVDYGISSGFGDDKLKGNNLRITGTYFLGNIYFDNANGLKEIGGNSRKVKCDFVFLPEFTVRNKKYKDVYKIWVQELEQVNLQYVDTIYTAKYFGLIYITQKSGASWARK